MIHWTHLIPSTPWNGKGDLPSSLPNNLEDAISFGEDLLQFRHTEKKLIIDVGWRPEANHQGHFICQIIENNNWKEPLNFIDIYDHVIVWIWLQESIAKYS